MPSGSTRAVGILLAGRRSRDLPMGSYLLVALVIAGLVACTSPAPPSPPETIAPSPPPVRATSSPAGSPASDDGSRPIPPALLQWVYVGNNRGLWRVAVSTRTRIQLPPGDWMVTVGPRDVFLASRDGSTALLVSRVVGTRLVIDKSVPLPSTEAWRMAFAACESAAGRLVVANGGARLYLVEQSGALRLIPGQHSNLGDCAWLDEEHLIWDQEDGPLMLWDSSTDTVTATGIMARSPSAAAGKVSYYDVPAKEVRLSPFTLAGMDLRLSRPIGTLPAAEPGTSLLSPDGQWVMAVGVEPDKVVLYHVRTALQRAGTVPLLTGSAVGWMPVTPSR